MYLSIILWLYSFLSNPILIIVCGLFFGLRLYLSDHKKQIVLLILTTSLFLISQQVNIPNFMSTSKVISVKEHKLILRNGINLYELKGASDYELGDKLKVNNYIYYEDRTQYQKSKRIKGQVKIEDSKLVKRKWNLKKYFHAKMPHDLKRFFDKEVETIFSVLSLQLLGLLELCKILSSKLLYKKQREYVELTIIILYMYLFGSGFSIMRILISRLFKDKTKYLPILLIMYPYSFYDMSFNLIYLPLILESLSLKFKHVNFMLLRIYFLMRLTGRLQILELILYPVLKLYAGMIVFLTITFRFNTALNLLNVGMHILNQHRLLIVGAPSIIWLYFYLFKSFKVQVKVMMLMLMVSTYNPFMRISMLNVYQGDATLISFPFNSLSILIDTGRASSYATLKRSLYKKGIKKIDYLVITHDDLDHSENKDRLIDEFKVEHLIENKTESIPFMKQYLTNVEYDDANENSLILEFSIKDFSFLVMGDAGINQEKDIVNQYPHKRIDVLKLGHHGSNTSSSLSFLQSLQPQLALISSDPRMYNHPHPEVLKRLHDLRITQIQTSIEGDVSIILMPIFKLIVSEGKAFGIMR